MAICKGCGAQILFISKMPVNPEQVTYWRRAGAKGKVVTPNGEVLSCDFEGGPQKATGVGYVTHFATCPKAADFRRRRSR